MLNKKDGLAALFPTLVAVLEDYGRRLVETYREGLKDGGHIATGNLYRSVESEVSLDGRSFVVEFVMPDYGEYLETGTSAHFPPVSEILKWVRAKRIAPRRDQQGRLPTEKQLAYLIARKISEDGTPRTGIWEKSNELTARDFNKRIDEAISKDLGDNLAGILQELNRKPGRRR